MSLPIAIFNFEVNFLGVSFTDMSQNTPTSWSWQFGDGNTSTERNPSHTYTDPGDYLITFTTTNDDGSDTFTYTLTVKDQINYGYSIDQIIDEERPTLIPKDSVFEDQRKKYWMLHLQILIDPKIADAFVFDETKWPNMVKILIANLVIRDVLAKLGKEAMTQSISHYNTINSQQITITESGNIISFVGTSATLNAPTGGDSYQWQKDGNNLAGATSQTYVASLPGSYTCIVTTATVPSTFGPIVVSMSNTTTSTTTAGGGLKSLETGPSKAEWYDVSQTISSIFKPVMGPGGVMSSVFDELTSDICSTASRLRIRLPFCPKLVQNTIIPIKVERPHCDSNSIFKKNGWI
jgi:PKD repeat protein